MEKMKRIKKRLSLTLRASQTIDESLSELAEQMTIEDGGTKDNGECLCLSGYLLQPCFQQNLECCVKCK